MRVIQGVLSVGILGCLAAASGCDSVQASGGDGAEDGLLVDGTSSGTAHVYDRYTGTDGSAISVGNYDTGGGDVVAFTVGHAPTLQPTATWTSSADHMTLAFDPKFKVKFQNWIVQGPFADGMSHAINACIRTSQIWHDERQGTAFSAFGVTDATANPQAANYTAFECTAKAAGIKTDIGFDPSAINVYWVNTVDFGNAMPLTSNGVSCGGNVVAMGANVLDHLFTHEIGHAFDLAHTNPIPAFFDVTNVMHNASNNRSFLTEGQTFRAVTDPVSAVNTLGGRTGIMRAACGSISGSVSISTTDPLCPAIQKRVWADGAAWPAN